MLVPYHPGSPRFLDLSTYSQGLVTLNASHCPTAVGGTLLGSPAVVCKEVHDRGLAWMNDANARRRQEVVLSGTIDAYNYNNVVWWAFRDDGAAEGRYGATALNLPGAETIAHMHTPIWRLDIDLDGFQGDAVHVASHVESGASATDSSTLVNRETGLEWKADEFTALHEDGESVNGVFRGAAHLMWTGWLLKPHNLFDRTPLFEPRDRRAHRLRAGW